MNKLITKTHWMCVGLLTAMTCGAPAVADDTEILLINPNAANPPKPNLMFIIDSSGSMGNRVTTRRLYDATRTYPQNASCDPNLLYWTPIGEPPACSGNTRSFAKTVFLCNAATARLTNIGSYTDTMAQFRLNSAPALEWQSLAPGATIAPVECENDRGVHGGFTNPTTDVYAVKGATTAIPPNLFTSDLNQEIDWTSGSVSQGITVYDGNYLNYRETPEFIDERKITIVQAVSEVILNSITGVNVGLMRFNDNDGGPVIHDIVDLDANRQSIVDTINGIVADGSTPLAETLYESALFWRGLPAEYGQSVNEHPTDPAALAQDDPEIYEQPELKSCAKNFNVLLTDGMPVADFDTPGLVDSLPNWATAVGQAGCVGTGAGHCLDDVAKYLFNDDLSTALPNDQLVTTHTIGFDIDLPILKATADASGGEYFLADDVESLTLALLKIVADVQERSLSFAAPAVAVNSFNRTQNLNDLYLTTFGARGSVHWPGNLKKYRIAGGKIVDSLGNDAVDPLTGFFYQNARSYWSAGPDGPVVEDGGAANEIPPPASRKLYTYNGVNTNLTSGSNAVSVANAAAFTLADFGLSGSAQEPTKDEIIDWARGLDLRDVDGDGDLTDARNQMGDPLHSQPAAVVYGGSSTNPDVVIYTATNDGYVHAIDGDTGAELWAFVPKEHLANAASLYFNLDAQYKSYGVDGDIIPVIKDNDDDGIIETADGDFVVIVFGMRRGGNNYYALDVTNRNQPKLLWQFSNAGMGQSWSPPSIARIKMAGVTQNADDAVVIVGGGYNTAHDTMAHPTNADSVGAGIYFLDLQSGNVLWRAGADTAAELTLSTMTRAIPSVVRAIDLNGDGFADRMYASDLGGQIWRFDISNGNDPNGIGNDALVAGGVVAQLGAEGLSSPTVADTRRFYSAPDVALFNDIIQNRSFVAINVGSGYRAHPLDNSNTDRFYSIRDKNVFNKLTQSDYDTFNVVTETDLVEVSGSAGAVIGPGKEGWMFTLPANQKVLAESVTFNNEVLFVTFSPEPNNIAAATCAAGVGRNFLYRVSITNGDPIADLSALTPGTEDQARVTPLAQSGIASSPVFLFPSPDDPNCTGEDCVTQPVFCVGPECAEDPNPNPPRRTLWTQDGIE